MTAAGMRLGIDAGGTFTDVMALDDAGNVTVVKVPSTSRQPARGPLDGIERIGASTTGGVSEIVHGTTVALNALLQRRFEPVWLLTTEGFRGVLEVGRGAVPGAWGSIYSWVKPPRVVPLERVIEVPGRIDGTGAEVAGLDEDAVRAAGRRLADAGARSVAVCLLHAYADPSHERRVRALLRAVHPSLRITLSSEVMPEFREYERTVTTAITAALAPLMGTYLDDLQHGVRDRLGDRTRLWIMRSNGGVAGVDEARDRPLATLMSGPAAGVLGMGAVAARAGFRDAITFDMGGTSTDVAAVRDGLPELTTQGEVDVYPLRVPAVDLVSIGAGGGSLAVLGHAGRLSVGPHSAGADPGPACYGRGGAQPTVTDANLVLGRIPQALVGDALPLDVAAARRALATIAGPLGVSVVQAAVTVTEVASHAMAGAIRQVSVRRGRDPRDHALVAYGGAGPLHAARVAELLGIPVVLVPPAPGLGSCVGLLVADLRLDAATTLVGRMDDLAAEQVVATLARLDADLAERAGADSPAARITHAVDLRYAGSETEVSVPLDGPVGAATLRGAVERFHALHEQLFGFAYRGRHPVESVTLRATAIGVRTEDPPRWRPPRDGVARPRAQRDVVFAFGEPPVPTPVYAREELPEGVAVDGPALVDQYDTTTVVPPRLRLEVDAHANLLLRGR